MGTVPEADPVSVHSPVTLHDPCVPCGASPVPYVPKLSLVLFFHMAPVPSLCLSPHCPLLGLMSLLLGWILSLAHPTCPVPSLSLAGPILSPSLRCPSCWDESCPLIWPLSLAHLLSPPCPLLERILSPRMAPDVPVSLGLIPSPRIVLTQSLPTIPVTPVSPLWPRLGVVSPGGRGMLEGGVVNSGAWPIVVTPYPPSGSGPAERSRTGTSRSRWDRDQPNSSRKSSASPIGPNGTGRTPSG